MSEQTSATMQQQSTTEGDIEKVLCPCGAEISKKNISAHEKTDLHTKKLKRIQDAKSVGALKIRERFDKIDSTLEILNMKLTEVLDVLYEDPREDEYNDDDKKNESEVSDKDIPSGKSESDEESGSSSDDDSNKKPAKKNIKKQVVKSVINKKPITKAKAKTKKSSRSSSE